MALTARLPSLTASKNLDLAVANHCVSPTLHSLPVTLTPALTAILNALPTLTIGGTTIALNSALEHILDGQTLTPGYPAIIVLGTGLSLAPSVSTLAVNSTKTHSLFAFGGATAPAAAESGGVGHGRV